MCYSSFNEWNLNEWNSLNEKNQASTITSGKYWLFPIMCYVNGCFQRPDLYYSGDPQDF